MALYQKQFAKPYPDGYVDKPQKTTPVTAEILNMQDNIFSALEEFLTANDVGFKNVTIGYRSINSQESTHTLSVGNGNEASAMGATALGYNCVASGSNSFATGQNTKANALCSHAEGGGTTANASASHAEGSSTVASGMNSHAEGGISIASGFNSHAEGNNTIASGNAQHVQGRYNIDDTQNKYAHIVGGGTYQERKNIHTLDWQGNAEFAGDVTNGNGVSLDGLMALIGTTGQLRTIVETLPEEDISTNTIYMVLKEFGGENDIYNEYINVDGTPEGWEFIGNSAVDMSDYYTKSQVDELLSEYVRTEIGKGLSSNDYTDSEKQLVESIINMTTVDAMAILNGEVA